MRGGSSVHRRAERELLDDLGLALGELSEAGARGLETEALLREPTEEPIVPRLALHQHLVEATQLGALEPARQKREALTRAALDQRGDQQTIEKDRVVPVVFASGAS